MKSCKSFKNYKAKKAPTCGCKPCNYKWEASQFEERIQQLENVFAKPAGTQISRTLDWDHGTLWSIGFGQIMAPKTFFIGKTIEEALSKAEEAVSKK